MSQAGRFAHAQNKKRHSQGGPQLALRQPETVATATWLMDSMAVCRALSRIHDNLWVVADFALYSAVDYDEAEYRLRYLSRLGFLRMGYDKEAKRYYWGMENPKLPTRAELN